MHAVTTQKSDTAPAYPSHVLFYFYFSTLSPSIALLDHCICTHETVAGDGGDRIACHVCVGCFVCVTQFYLKKTSVVSRIIFRFGPSTFDRLHGQHVGAGITHGGSPPLAVAPRFHGITFLFGW